MAKKNDVQTSDGLQQITFEVEKKEVEKIEEELEVDDETLKDERKLDEAERRWVSKPESKINIDNYVFAKSEEGRLQLKVVTVYDLTNVEGSPDPELLEHEIGVWRENLLRNIGENSVYLKKALQVLTR